MIAVSYDGVTFSDLNIDARIVRALPGPDRQPVSLDRVGASSLLVGMTHGLRTITVTFFPQLQQQAETRLLTLLKSLQPDNDLPRTLVAQIDLNSDDTAETSVQVEAAVGGWNWLDSDGKGLVVNFVTADPAWSAATASSATGSSVDGGASATASITVTNSGHATVAPTITFEPTSAIINRPQVQRRQVTVTNNTAHALVRYPFRLDLGDTSGWGWYNDLFDGSDDDARATEFRVWRDGKAVDREPVNVGYAQSYCWIVIDELGAGESATYDLTYGGASGYDAVGWSPGEAPVFDIAWEKGTATSGTTTSLTNSGASWQSDQYRDGQIEIIAGTGTGQGPKDITTNTGTVISINSGSPWSPAPDATSVYLVTRSSNDRWVYAVRQTERSDKRRGLWYTSGAGQSRPNLIRYDAPGSWYLYSYLDNDDTRAQKEVTPVNVGTVDYFAILDANRTWQAHPPFSAGSPVHDGVAFAGPLQITQWIFDYQSKNPNGICEMFFGCREAGGSGWTSLLSDTTAHSSLTSVAGASYTPDANITPTELVAAALPRDETSIPDTWRVDAGTWSSGGLSTFGDATKTDWVLGQWTGATITIISGTGQGQQSTVTGNSGGSSTLLTVSPSWTVQPDATSRYQIVNPGLTATLRCGNRFRVDFDDSDLTQSLGAEATNYAIAATLYLDTTFVTGTPQPPYSRIRIDGSTRQLFLSAGEALELDGTRRRARVINATTGDLIRSLAGGYAVAEDVDSDGTAHLAGDWFDLTPGAHTLDTTDVIVGDFTITYTPGYYG